MDFQPDNIDWRNADYAKIYVVLLLVGIHALLVYWTNTVDRLSKKRAKLFELRMINSGEWHEIETD